MEEDNSGIDSIIDELKRKLQQAEEEKAARVQSRATTNTSTGINTNAGVQRTNQQQRDQNNSEGGGKSTSNGDGDEAVDDTCSHLSHPGSPLNNTGKTDRRSPRKSPTASRHIDKKIAAGSNNPSAHDASMPAPPAVHRECNTTAGSSANPSQCNMFDYIQQQDAAQAKFNRQVGADGISVEQYAVNFPQSSLRTGLGLYDFAVKTEPDLRYSQMDTSFFGYGGGGHINRMGGNNHGTSRFGRTNVGNINNSQRNPAGAGVGVGTSHGSRVGRGRGSLSSTFNSNMSSLGSHFMGPQGLGHNAMRGGSNLMDFDTGAGRAGVAGLGVGLQHASASAINAPFQTSNMQHQHMGLGLFGQNAMCGSHLPDLGLSVGGDGLAGFGTAGLPQNFFINPQLQMSHEHNPRQNTMGSSTMDSGPGNGVDSVPGNATSISTAAAGAEGPSDETSLNELADFLEVGDEDTDWIPLDHATIKKGKFLLNPELCMQCNDSPDVGKRKTFTPMESTLVFGTILPTCCPMWNKGRSGWDNNLRKNGVVEDLAEYYCCGRIDGGCQYSAWIGRTAGGLVVYESTDEFGRPHKHCGHSARPSHQNNRLTSLTVAQKEHIVKTYSTHVGREVICEEMLQQGLLSEEQLRDTPKVRRAIGDFVNDPGAKKKYFNHRWDNEPLTAAALATILESMAIDLNKEYVDEEAQHTRRFIDEPLDPAPDGATGGLRQDEWEKAYDPIGLATEQLFVADHNYGEGGDKSYILLLPKVRAVCNNPCHLTCFPH